MPSLPVLMTLAREILTLERSPRVPEPDLVMDNPSKVAAFEQAGQPDGVMAPVYLFNCAHACSVIRPGDTVLDLACGPANQLVMIAEMNPSCRFIGVDLSEPMLERAARRIDDFGLANVALRRADITRLQDITDHSVDAVVSTMALHHLPTARHLEAAFREVARVLHPDGGVYMVDFGHLKAAASIEYFAYQYVDHQPELFTLDYLNSLRAAFSLADFKRASAQLGPGARLYSTFLAPFLVAVKSRARNPDQRGLCELLRAHLEALRPHHRRDLADLKAFFGAGGLRTPALA